VRAHSAACALKNSPVTSQRYGTLKFRFIIGTWCKAGMKLRSCIFWVLGLLLAIASVDPVPDPPAVNPGAIDVAFVLRDVRDDVHERWLNSASSISLLFRFRSMAFTSAYEPILPTDRIVLTAFATDPSPPFI